MAPAKKFEVWKIHGVEIDQGKEYYRVEWTHTKKENGESIIHPLTLELVATFDCPQAVKDFKKAQTKYEVESIEDVRDGTNGKKEYFIKWKNFPSSKNTWEPEENLTCPAELRNFEKRRKKEKREEEEEHFEIKYIDDVRTNKDGEVEYQMIWADYPPSWEPEEYAVENPRLLEEVEHRHGISGRQREQSEWIAERARSKVLDSEKNPIDNLNDLKDFCPGTGQIHNSTVFNKSAVDCKQLDVPDEFDGPCFVYGRMDTRTDYVCKFKDEAKPRFLSEREMKEKYPAQLEAFKKAIGQEISSRKRKLQND